MIFPSPSGCSSPIRDGEAWFRSWIAEVSTLFAYSSKIDLD
jgi:hypothetical protein